MSTLANSTKPRIVFLATMIAITSLGCYFTGGIEEREPLTIVTGEYWAVGNPCTTRPCLPGVVYAVFVDDTYYHVTVEGSWLWVPEGNRSWDGYTPQEGDFVTVTGYLNKRLDVFGDPFYEIEVVSLRPASAY